MKYYFLIILLVFSLISFSQERFVATCQNFTGANVQPGTVTRDGYSDTTITLVIADGDVLVTYSGRNERTDVLSALANNDDFFSFYKAFNDVHKIYSLYPASSKMILTEIQTELFSGTPEVRAFVGNCSFR